MNEQTVKIKNCKVPCYSLNTLVIGSGIAGLNAALCLYECGLKNIAVVTEEWGGGTSNNTGSDKQTYYKMSISGDLLDSPVKMAQDLFNGGCMHGDIALCEAVNSVRCFMRLVNLGVPFPHDRYGSYVGYKTDNDPLGRAASAGPQTSQLMFKCLSEKIQQIGIPIFNQHQVISLLDEKEKEEKKIVGAVALDKTQLNSESGGFVLFNAVNVVLSTGGPAGMYHTSVYPKSQKGSTGLALKVGAVGQNLTESQFGLASVPFRWNLSGAYQQVIPRYISTDQKQREETEFLNDFFPDSGRLSTAIFSKGYEWPFDVHKVQDYGSSLIDILVYRETVQKQRRVFLDFTQNLSVKREEGKFDFSFLSSEAYNYLEKSGILFGTPVQRLRRLNEPAYQVFKNNGIDLEKEPLEIAVCAQHNNGGLKGNIWWESNIKHLFPVGEVNGSHGVRRPGGSSLNSCQVGGLRAALFISKKYSYSPPSIHEFIPKIKQKTEEAVAFTEKIRSQPSFSTLSLKQIFEEIKNRMSCFGAIIRNKEALSKEKARAWKLYHRIEKQLSINSTEELPGVFSCLDACLTSAVYLEAMCEYLEKGGKSRGSFLVMDSDGIQPCPELSDDWKYSLGKPGAFVDKRILELHLGSQFRVKKKWVPVRQIPKPDLWFEKIWEDFRKDKIIGQERSNE
ncbi:MAG: FAD-binding protein [Candidatus Aminicenantes bacterium]|nr:FAD-binding protein [Candidatus Aminicenantes bacterium]